MYLPAPYVTKGLVRAKAVKGFTCTDLKGCDDIKNYSISPTKTGPMRGGAHLRCNRDGYVAHLVAPGQKLPDTVDYSQLDPRVQVLWKTNGKREWILFKFIARTDALCSGMKDKS